MSDDKSRDAVNAYYITREFQRIEQSRRMIDDLAKQSIPDFHFMSHKVSDFWSCDLSPIGRCVWDISENGYNKGVDCMFCHQPTERK